MPPRKADSDDGKAVWIDPEVIALLNGLISKKSTHQSGNGWKPTVWPEIVVLVQAANPAADPKKDQVKCISKINYLQKCLGQYLFVKKYSGVGWDDEDNHATATVEFIETFIKINGPKYTKCFKKPCPFYTKLNELFDGLVNKATGEHVVHLGGNKRKSGKNSNAPKKALAPATEEMSVAALGDDSEKENDVVEVDKGEGGSKGKGRAVFDDELSMSPREKASRNQLDDDDDTPPARLHKRQKSDSSTRSTARRNAEAGSQLAKSVETLSAAMGKPIITSEDLSYVDKVIDILKDKSLLPPDPKGRLFRIVCQKLSGDTGLARCLIVEEDYTRRKGLLEGILEDAGQIIPEDPPIAATAD
ncbi:hypothetical protein DFH08DRAFT_938508 [Mycena albidolilacea]|uniref:Myb/SANT-like domain-containing protein n=1 Tax=Mycena albidolilacea TaxID=1033008 RepID=A0AAD7ENC1_9AGAR|nr:hypothetical protein DFH08DRAFT_938508 [Mycena albidolilacea]